MKKENIKTGIIIILIIVILVSALFIGIPKYNQYQQIKGAQIGYEQAIIDIMNQVSSCQRIPLIYNNQTIEIIAIGCLKNGGLK